LESLLELLIFEEKFRSTKGVSEEADQIRKFADFRDCWLTHRLDIQGRKKNLNGRVKSIPQNTNNKRSTVVSRHHQTTTIFIIESLTFRRRESGLREFVEDNNNNNSLKSIHYQTRVSQCHCESRSLIHGHAP
jgi:hypothetical protein